MLASYAESEQCSVGHAWSVRHSKQYKIRPVRKNKNALIAKIHSLWKFTLTQIKVHTIVYTFIASHSLDSHIMLDIYELKLSVNLLYPVRIQADVDMPVSVWKLSMLYPVLRVYNKRIPLSIPGELITDNFVIPLVHISFYSMFFSRLWLQYVLKLVW